MSRIGKMPVALPQGVTVEFKDGVVTVKGGKGTLSREITGNIDVVVEAFRAAHTLKGVCQNLGFSNLYAPAVTLTETLRAGQLEGTAEQFAEVEKQYRITMAAIQALD